MKVGLWRADDVQPVPRAPGGVELSFSEESTEAVRQTYDAWRKLGLKVVQEPTHMDFGFTFVVEDPDGHRLRPFVLSASPR
jgi:predicted lactoylglutathione lyase